MLNRQAWLAALVGIGALVMHSEVGATEFTLDPSRTVVAFEMRSMGTVQRGEFRRTAGTVMLDPAEERGELEIVIDARSLQASSRAATKFVRGPSMLDTAAHPEIAYRAQRIVFERGKPARIEGELTLLGVTKPVTLKVHVNRVGTHSFSLKRVAGFSATTTIRRSDFGMKHLLPAVGDEVEVRLEIEGIKAKKDE